MKKFRVIYLIYLIIITILGFMPAKRTSSEMNKITIYFADKQMMRLVPVDYYISSKKPQKCADFVLNELVKERNYDSNIRRILPGDEDALSVDIKNDIAIVNLKSICFSDMEKGKLQEQLIVYQLVNSLSSIQGIKRVKFLIDGDLKKDLFGFMDMRESYIPDYCV